MVIATRVHGKTARCMEKEEYILTLIAMYTKVTFRMESAVGMEKEFIFTLL